MAMTHFVRALIFALTIGYQSSIFARWGVCPDMEGYRYSVIEQYGHSEDLEPDNFAIWMISVPQHLVSRVNLESSLNNLLSVQHYKKTPYLECKKYGSSFIMKGPDYNCMHYKSGKQYQSYFQRYAALRDQSGNEFTSGFDSVRQIGGHFDMSKSFASCNNKNLTRYSTFQLRYLEGGSGAIPYVIFQKESYTIDVKPTRTFTGF